MKINKILKQKLSSKIVIIVTILVVLAASFFIKNNQLENTQYTNSKTVIISPTSTTDTLIDKQLSPVSTLSNGWITYTDPAHCYTFSIPGDWIVTYDREDGDFGNKHCSENSVGMKVAFEEQGKNYYLTVSISAGGHGVPNNDYLTKRSIKVGELDYTLTTISHKSETQPYEISASPSDKQASLKLPQIAIHQLPPVNRQEYIDNFYQILSTVNFTQ